MGIPWADRNGATGVSPVVEYLRWTVPPGGEAQRSVG